MGRVSDGVMTGRVVAGGVLVNGTVVVGGADVVASGCFWRTI